MFIKDISEYCLQNDDYVSCVTGVMVINGPSFISQDRIIDLPAFFQHALEEADTEYRKKCSVAALSHIQNCMHASNNDTINWEGLAHYQTIQDFCGPFATYIDRYARKMEKVKVSVGNSSAYKKSAKIRKKQRQLLFSMRPKAVQLQNQIFFWKILGHQK